MPVYKDKPRGTWYVSVYVNGKKTTRRGFRTKAEAQREEALLTVGKAHVRMKVITLTDEYLEHKKKRLKESTLHTYTDYKNLFICPMLGDRYVTDIKYKDAEEFLEKISDQGYSANYCNHVFGFAKSVWKFGQRYHGLEANPFALVERPRSVKKAEMKTWTPEEFSRFYKALSSRRAQIMFLVMFWTGIRRGEMRGLQWTDYDRTERTIKITKQFSRYGGITEPKTDSGKRVIDIPSAVCKELDAYYEWVSGHEGFSETWYMFGDKEPIGLNTIAWHLKKGIELSGVTPIRLHDFRHSHASWLFANRFDTAYISARLGHSSIAITLSIYTHLMDDVRQRERKKLNDSVTLF
jgi:integrase